LGAAWDEGGGPVLSVTGVRRTTVSADSAVAALLSLNSCLGCGEYRYLPEELSRFPEVFRRLNRSITAKREFELLGEQLDTPAFAEQDIGDLIAVIDDLPRTTAAVVTGHHNILPQALLRVAVYTEVLNSGLVRSRLAQCGRRVIYCHGHIHGEPVDIVTTPMDPDGGVVLVSTPEFARGFNVLEIQYGVKGYPLGLLVRPYRVGSDGGVRQRARDVLRVRLVSPRDVGACSPDRMTSVLDALEGDAFLKGQQALELAQRGLGMRITRKSLGEILLDAEWLGGVEIRNRERDFTEWHIGRVAGW
jgi:hypothetical protein